MALGKYRKNNSPIVLDSFAVLALFFDEPGSAAVARVLELAQKKQVNIFMHELNAGEVYYRIVKETKNIEQAERALALLRALPITWQAANFDFVLAAARWKAKYSISYADAFALETAVKNSAVLWTNDPEFFQVSEVKVHQI